ncbi:MAG: sulfatase-like hydrolase/transferase [Myxococcota bacterium]
MDRNEPRAQERASEGPGPLVFALALPLFAALAQAPSEFAYYRRWLELGSDEAGLRALVALLLFAKTGIVLAGLALGLLFGARRVSAAGMRLAALVGTFVVLGLVAADLEVKRLTGNALAVYLPFLFEAETLVWAGTGFDPGPAVLRTLGRAAALVGLAAVPAFALERWTRADSPRRARRVVATAFAVFAFAPAAGLVAAAFAPAVVLSELRDQVPGFGSIALFAPAEERATRAASAAVAARYAEALPALRAAPRALPVPPIGPDAGPDVLLVVVESLRADALDPGTMPFLSAWSRRGLRLDRHAATSNASHYGLFALLYGRSPLRYFETVASDESPTLVEALRRAGYARHLVTCAELDWRRMKRFMGPPHFALERLAGPDLAACDREVITRARALLAEPGDAPRLVLAFLMSTHFGFHHPEPPDFLAPFAPALPPPNASTLDPERDRAALHNRYRNSAHYVDALLAELLEPIETERTLVVVTGDHGESLYDDGTLAHASRLSAVQVRVPFVLAGPGVPPDLVRDTPTDHADVARTVLARLGASDDALARLPGRDLVDGAPRAFLPWIHAKARPDGVDRVALVGDDVRVALRLDPERGRARVVGPLDEAGRLVRRALSAPSSARVADWLGAYLSETVSVETSPPTPIE